MPRMRHGSYACSSASYTASMGERNRDRQLREAKSEYLGALHRLRLALRAISASDIPMDPGSGREPPPWTQEHLQVITDVARNLNEVIERRRSWVALHREWQAPH